MAKTEKRLIAMSYESDYEVDGKKFNALKEGTVVEVYDEDGVETQVIRKKTKQELKDKPKSK